MKPIRWRPSRGRLTAIVLVVVVALGAAATSSDYVRAAAKEAVRGTADTHDQEAMSSLHPAIRGYVEAVDAEDVDALVAVFDDEGTVTDTGREFRGHEEIRAWARDEVIGGRLTVLRNTPRDGGSTVLLRFDPEGLLAGFRANYTFEVQEDRIRRVSMAYA
ncbi:nuclear transport factor 2 family protein [Streptomyces phyllanthi]|uniref:Nuclear transport factor 2 family protein n=1 Tax=Streptomyces phyllanthi TaxID=1803180 RepID=A0A5N8W8F3_9ACTN|nr:nuclear transport factor 2 family protein [Streptomyces phyllanthi]MPY43750.1 nuclear transport factor 2 family protein [Streptomyces phyllanthi]